MWNLHKTEWGDTFSRPGTESFQASGRQPPFMVRADGGLAPPQLPGTGATFPASHSECWEGSHWSSTWTAGAGLLHDLRSSFWVSPCASLGVAQNICTRHVPCFPTPPREGIEKPDAYMYLTKQPEQSHYRPVSPG